MEVEVDEITHWIVVRWLWGGEGVEGGRGVEAWERDVTSLSPCLSGHETLCSLEWMDVLGDLFKSNRNNTIIGDGASYQYFASANGSMVYYPGMEVIHLQIP